MSTDVDTLNTRLGQDTNGDGVYDTGLLSLITCSVINGKYQAILNVVCGDGFSAVASCFETFISFACFIATAEFIRRKLPTRSNSSVSPATAPSPQARAVGECHAAATPDAPPSYDNEPDYKAQPLMQVGSELPPHYATGAYPYPQGPPFKSDFTNDTAV